MNIQDLLNSLPDTCSLFERESIIHAYQFAEKAHATQKRASGEPYVTHCVAVGIILAEMRVPPIVITAALLHDTVEDTGIRLEDLQREFGDEVAGMVDGVTKLTNLPKVARGNQPAGEVAGVLDTQGDAQPLVISEQIIGPSSERNKKRDLASESLRKIFMAMNKDIRIVLIKLADRLHNMRTLGYMPEAKRRQIAQETLDIFAPLANRLGIWQIKGELEDLSFRHLNPYKFKEIADNLQAGHENRDQEISNIITKLTNIMQLNNIKAEITGRPKHIYSIYRKMIEKGRNFEMIMDVRAVRLIVPDVPSCYAALGFIHTNWRPIPHEFDDYIASPKDNFYRSIHTAVLYEDGKPLEVQIRTPEMHQEAEYGIAAHWRYKEKGGHDKTYEQRINWIRQLMDWQHDIEDAQEFVDGMKTDVFQDRVYVFTPRGDIINMPIGSTPIDFAYQIHTEIGHRCRGAKINGKLVTLEYQLRTGDQVEILTAKQGGPSLDWLNKSLGLVTTQRAKSKIKAWFKRQNHENNLAMGKSLLERELRRLGLQDVDLEKLSMEFDFKTTDDFFAALGQGDISQTKVVNKLSEVGKDKQDPLFEIHPPSDSNMSTQAVAVLGVKGLLTNIGHCCNPVPGDEIVGYITRGRGATIHRRDCPNILNLSDHERLVQVTWGEHQQTYPVSIQLRAYDRQGLMGDISNILINEGINMLDVDLKVNHNLTIIHLVLEVKDISQLSRVLTKIENVPNVIEVHRYRPGKKEPEKII